MRKCLLIIALIALLLPGVAFPQNPGTSCGQKEVTDRLLNNNPHLKVFQQQIEKQLQVHALKVKQGLEQPFQPNAVVTLPVVVHIIHNNGTENLSDAQVFTAIQHLNQAFANTGYYDPADGVNTEIQFCLAQRDPNNNPTNGIDRVASPLTVMDGWNNGSQDIAVKNLSRWDPRCYINIWIVREITGPVAGYAYLPSAHGMNIDGIVGEAAYFGSSNANDVLIIHEMGHYLGLYHTFQGGCTNNDCIKDGDQVCDTPPDQSTAGISCNSTANSCSTDALSGFSTDVNDLHTDYLDYGNWNCMKVFTQGQATRMNWMIQNVRQSLLSCRSCMSPCPAPVTANFSSSGNNVPIGSTVNFTNSSVNASGYKWYINNNLQTTTTNFSYTFNTIGTYIIKLWALSNNTLCDSAVRFDTVRVTCPVTASFTPGTQLVPINTTINFTNTSTGATTYQWLINGIPQSAALNYPHLFSSAGYYEIKLRANYGLCYDSVTAIITVIDTTTQPPPDSCFKTTYQRIFNNPYIYQTDMVELNGGDYLTIGNSRSNPADPATNTGNLNKFSNDGNLIWNKKYDYRSSHAFKDLIPDGNNGGIILGGSRDNQQNNNFIHLLHVDADGNVLNSKTYSFIEPRLDIQSIYRSAEGDIYIYVHLNRSAFSSRDAIMLVKLDPSFNILWSKQFDPVTNALFQLYDITEAGNNIILSSLEFWGPGKSLLVAVDKTSGNIVNTKHFIINNTQTRFEFLKKSNQTTDFFVSGSILNSISIPFLLRFDNNLVLQRSFLSDSTLFLGAPDLAIGPNDDILLGGNYRPTTQLPPDTKPCLVKLNSTFDLLWKKRYTFPTALGAGFHQIQFTRNNQILTGGLIFLPSNLGGEPYALFSKFTLDGELSECNSDDMYFGKKNYSLVTGDFLFNTLNSPLQPVNGQFTPLPHTNPLIATECSGTINTCSDTIPPVDSCGRSTFQKLYTARDGLELSTMNSTRDGGTIHAGVHRMLDFAQVNALVTKLDKAGNVKWSTAVKGMYASQFYQARETRDGGFLAVGQTTVRSGEQSRVLLVKFTAAGVISWLRTYKSATGSARGDDLIELSTNQFAIVGNERFGSNTYGLLLITDETGNINLSKLYRTEAPTLFQSVVQSADTLAIAGMHENNTSYVGTILNVNVWTGAVIKSVEFQMNDRGNTHNIIYKQPYGYFLSTFMVNNQDWNTKQNGVIRLNHNLQLIDAFKKDQLDETPSSVSIPMHDTGYVIPTTNANGFTLMGVGQDNHPTVWGNIYGTSVGKTEPVNPIALDDGLYLAGAKYILEIGKRNFLFVRTNRLGQTPDCEGTPPTQSTSAVSANISSLQWNDISNFINVPGESFLYYTESVPITITTLCNACDSIIIPPDTCSSITFQKKIGGAGIDHAFDIKALANNEYIIAGSTTSTPGTGNNEEALLIKLNNKGNILWQKSIGGFKKDQYTKIVVNAAGEYLVFGKTESQHNANGSMLLTKFDANGVILWAKEYNFTNASLTGFENVAGAIELSNGDIAFCGNALGINTEVGQPLPATFNIIGVLSSTGTLRWVKRLREYYLEGGGAVTGIIEMNGSFFIIANYGIFKMNAADGSVIGFNKKFQNLGSFNSIELYGSQIIVYSSTHKVVFDQNLNLVSAYIPLSNEPNYGLNFNGQSSNNGSIMQGSISKYLIDYSVFLSRFSGAANKQWAYKYPYPQSERRYLSGSRQTIDNGFVSIGEMAKRKDEYFNHPADIFILRTDSVGRIPDCQRASIDFTMQSVQGNYIELHARNYPISTLISNLTPQALNPQLTVQSLCATEDCSTLILSAKDTVCSFSDTVQIKAYKDSACDAFTEWLVDTTVARIISQNDTLLKLQFKRSRVFTIYARLTGGCRLLQDSVTLTVFNSPDSVNLGPDIQLCKISTYTFNAGTGFKSYKWQDGSTDSTLTIYYPGTYHVTAEDYCGNLYRDTVVVSQSPDIPFDLGPDLKKCNNDTLTITAPAGFNKYYWSPGYRIDNLYSRVIKVSPDRDTTYTVIAERSPGCLVTDSIRVTVNHSIPLRIGNDTSFCQNDSITITATPGFTNYQWNTGANSQSILVKAAGQYRVSATDSNGCISRDSLDILPLFILPAVNIGADLSVCRNTIHEFDAGSFTTYLWQDGSVGRRFRTSQTGTYWVRVSNANGCVNQDTATIISYLESPQNFLDSSADICLGQLLEIKAATGFSRYRWFNNSSSSAINITAPGIYWVEVTTADGCTGRDSISVKAKDCLKGVFFPNAFTPATGQANNFFRPVVYGRLESFHMIVYNRYGQKVFETRDAYKGWDGKINGLMQGTNTFAWSAIYRFSGASEKQQSAKGTVTLIR